MIIVIAAITTPEKLPVMNKGTNTLRGKELLRRAAEFGLIAAIALSAVGELCASPDAGRSRPVIPDGTGQNGKGNSAQASRARQYPCCLPCFGRRGDDRFLRTVGSFSGCHDSRTRRIIHSAFTPWPRQPHPIHASGGMKHYPGLQLFKTRLRRRSSSSRPKVNQARRCWNGFVSRQKTPM